MYSSTFYLLCKPPLLLILVISVGVPVKRDTPQVAKLCTTKASQNEQSQVVNKKKDCKKTKKLKTDADPLTAIHSFAELTEFLASETQRRKQDRKSSWSRRLSQTEWKALRQTVRSAFNPKTPNKSVKLARKMLREAVESR